ncbi:protein kinase domain-containing protein [Pontibacter sp. 13R65]
MPTLHRDNVFADRFLLKELIGSRGITELWKAEDLLENGVVVGIKIFAPQSRLDEQSLAQLMQDLEKANTLAHPNLLQPFETGLQEGVPYQVLPFMHNGSLRQKLHDQGTLTEPEVAQLLKQAGSALFYLHANEIPTLHKNLTPDNILISDKGDFVLTDFGISSRTRSAIRKVVGLGVASPAEYAPPEMFSSKPRSTAASDIFSFGVILYEACSGEVPWLGNGGIALLQGASIPQLPFRYSRELQQMVKACLDPDWEKRPSAAELEEEGAYYLEHGTWKSFGRFGTVTVKMVQYEKRSPWKPILISAILLLVLLAFSYFYFFAPDSWRNLTSSEPTAIVVKNGDLSSPATNAPEDTGNSKAGANNTTAPITEKKPVTATIEAPKTAPPTASAKKAVGNSTRSSTPAKTTGPRTGIRKPATLTGYFQQLQNQDVPLAVRQRWSADIQRYFTPEAIITYSAKGNVVGVFTVNEIIDMLLKADSSSTIRLGNTVKDEHGKIEELYLHSSNGL